MSIAPIEKIIIFATFFRSRLPKILIFQTQFLNFTFVLCLEKMHQSNGLRFNLLIAFSNHLLTKIVLVHSFGFGVTLAHFNR